MRERKRGRERWDRNETTRLQEREQCWLLARIHFRALHPVKREKKKRPPLLLWPAFYFFPFGRNAGKNTPPNKQMCPERFGLLSTRTHTRDGGGVDGARAVVMSASSRELVAAVTHARNPFLPPSDSTFLSHSPFTLFLFNFTLFAHKQ